MISFLRYLPPWLQVLRDGGPFDFKIDYALKFILIPKLTLIQFTIQTSEPVFVNLQTSEPVFVNLLRSPGTNSQPGGFDSSE
jgi:hypothetical protein